MTIPHNPPHMLETKLFSNKEELLRRMCLQLRKRSYIAQTRPEETVAFLASVSQHRSPSRGTKTLAALQEDKTLKANSQ